MTKIKEALQKRFNDHQVIFWYDAKEDFAEEYAALSLDNVEKVRVEGNEFAIKYLVTKQSVGQQYLLYFPQAKPANEDNWLLDLELAHYVFHTDQEAMFLQELGLGYHLKELVTEHLEFFKAKERRQKLLELLEKGDEHQEVRQKMLAVVFRTKSTLLPTLLHTHGSAFIEADDRLDKELERYNLQGFYWQSIAKKYNYLSEKPGIYDFLLEVFQSNFALGKSSELNKDGSLLLSLWKDSVQYQDSFGKIAKKVGEDIDVEGLLNAASLEDILEDDLFQLTDQKIIYDLVNLVAIEEISFDKVNQHLKQRENKFWYASFEDWYKCLAYGAELIALVRQHGGKKYEYFEEGTAHYAKELFLIDQVYRKFVWHYRRTNQDRILAELATKVEKIYANDWLLTYNNNWQKVIDKLTTWPTKEVNSQQRFFEREVQPFLQKKQKVYVIISDALRYECGVELCKRLLAENRYDAEVDYQVSSLPSYTQLCMASMLPHQELVFKEESDLVVVDGMASNGTAPRTNILATNSGVRAVAINAKDLMAMNAGKEGRIFLKEHDTIYIYHNRIDKVGDDLKSEDQVFEAVEEELKFLMKLIRKVSNMNGTNMIVTSDHGFVYQRSKLAESDFSNSKYTGNLWKENRRFVIGQDLSKDDVVKAFKGRDLNIASEVDVLIPKSINRLRSSGAGSKFIHGGASLQEIIVPLVRVNKRKQDTTSQVEIDIIKSTDKITTNILPVAFIQTNLVTEQTLPRIIRATLQAEDGTLLSDIFNYTFDISEGSERHREVKHSFVLSSKASSEYKNQRVQLILEEPIKETNRWKIYKSYYYTLSISFKNDFDF